MAPPALSNNWKLLQQKLQNDAASKGKPPKRKAAEAEDTTKKTVKKLKPSLINGRDKLSSSAKNPDYKTIKPAAARKMNGAITTTIVKTTTTLESLTSWAEDNDISTADLTRAYNLPSGSSRSAKTSEAMTTSSEMGPSKVEVGRYIAIDCEMVGVGGEENERSALARVSIVNYHGHLVLDTFVKPKERVTDWRTWVSGVSAADMKNAITFEEVQQQVSDLFKSRILVGHAIKHDLEVLLLSHPKRDIRDTSRHPTFRKLSQGKTPGLKKLARELLGIDIQGGEHSSIEDARACMSLYRLQKEEFEALHAAKYPNHTNSWKEKGGKKKKKKKKKKKGGD